MQAGHQTPYESSTFGGIGRPDEVGSKEQNVTQCGSGVPCGGSACGRRSYQSCNTVDRTMVLYEAHVFQIVSASHLVTTHRFRILFPLGVLAGTQYASIAKIQSPKLNVKVNITTKVMYVQYIQAISFFDGSPLSQDVCLPNELLAIRCSAELVDQYPPG